MTELKGIGPARDTRPVDPHTKRPVAQTNQPGYYPGYSALSQKSFWDAATRETIERRVHEAPPIRFFTPGEERLMQAVCDRVLPQDDRLPEFRIPVLNYIDARLFDNRIDGYRFEGMPPDQDAYRLGLKALDETSQALHGVPFLDLTVLNREEVLRTIHDGRELAAARIWAQMSIKRFWQILVTDCVTAYYAHPWAWDEIGYGGPAYPRGYMRLEGGLPEPWEVDEQRYEWEAPRDTISDHYDRSGSEESHHGQGGTH